MKLIRPKHISDAYLTYSNVAEADYAAWSGATTYAVGDKVIVVSPSSTVTMTIASPCVITWTAHGLIDGDIVVFTTTDALPAGLTAGAHYYVTALTADTFTVSSTLLNPRPITTSGSQSGTHTATLSSHKIYESLQAGNTNHVPRNSATWWLDTGSTNRWKMFDQSINSQTTNADSIQVTLATTGLCDSVALLNISAATARFRMTDSASGVVVTTSIANPCVVTQTGHSRVAGDKVVLSTTGALPTGLVVGTTYYVVNPSTNTYNLSATSGGVAITTSGSQSGTHTVKTVVYDNTCSLVSNSGISDWYAYFFEPVVRKRELVEFELPKYSNAILDIFLESSGEMVDCGACVIGQQTIIGDTQYGVRTGIQDYSTKTRDAFGNYSVLSRAYAKRADMTMWVTSGRETYIQDTLSDCRATPIVYVGDEAFGNTVVYGFYKDFTVDISYPTVSICNLSIEGLT